ncbi:DMT family transporter [Arenibaculum pallidiluteum]|uniref:DMT family transporter n=1 Tax=Arenibaculum pallidiluteum TaxID=2812559 RepID=UPI001A9577FF|nr:DMT family transporter [Arenibaculum pallidiluteum]
MSAERTAIIVSVIRRASPAWMLAPALFVALWSTGFLVARAAAPHADLNLFLLARFALAAGILAVLSVAAGVPWPGPARAAFHLGCGALMHGVYLVAGYGAVAMGMPVAVMALLGALQPLLAGLAMALFGRPPSRGLWGGLALAMCGTGMVLAPALGSTGSFPVLSLAPALLAVVALTAGTVLQGAEAARGDLRSAGAIQNAGGALVALAALLAFGNMRWDGAGALWIALAWSALGLSVVAVNLLVGLVRREGAAKASALMLLAPPLAALLSFLAFGEQLRPVQVAGFLPALLGVLVARRPAGTAP